MKTEGRLTDQSLRQIQPQKARVEVRDEVVRGLVFIVQPSAAKSWAVRYRANGKKHKLTLGTYPKIGLAAARDLARDAIKAVAAGRDPAGEKREARRRAVAGLDDRDLFQKVYETYKKRHIERELKQSTADEITRLFDKEILPKFKKRRLAEITKADVISLLDGLVDRGAPTMANRVLAVLRHFLNWCLGRNIIAQSPLAGIAKPTKEESRDRVLTDDEIRWFWKACSDDGYPFGHMGKLLLLTAARRDEVRCMVEKEVDVPARSWSLPKERVKNSRDHEIALSESALAVIKDVPKIRNKPGYLFCTNGKNPCSGFSRSKARIYEAMLKLAREEARKRGDDPAKVEIPDWRIHDLRRTAASGMARLGVALPVVERCLNHISGSFSGVAGIYNRYEFAEEKRVAFERWGDFVRDLVEGRRADKIIPIQTRKAERRAAAR